MFKGTSFALGNRLVKTSPADKLAATNDFDFHFSCFCHIHGTHPYVDANIQKAGLACLFAQVAGK